MNYNSTQTQGYEPKFSGPNHSYYLGDSGSLLGLMQTGGQPSSAYQSSFGHRGTAGGSSFARTMQRVADAKSLEDYQRKEAERQKKAGLIGGILGFGGSLIGGAVGGPGGAAAGQAVGQGMGEWMGAGRPTDVNLSGTVYGQQAFRDVGEASEDYSEGIGGRALLSGLETGVSALLTPGGGMYGTYNPLTETGLENITKAASGEAIKMFDPTKKQSLFKFAEPIFGQRSQFWSQPVNAVTKQDGGLLGMSHGGFTAEGILTGAGLDPTYEQSKLFEDFGKEGIEASKSGVQQDLMSLTDNQGLASANTGFGASGKAVTSAIEMGEDIVAEKTAAEQKAFESKTMGTAGDIVAGGGEFEDISDEQTYQAYVQGGGTVPDGWTGGTPDSSTSYIDPEGTEWTYTVGYGWGHPVGDV